MKSAHTSHTTSAKHIDFSTLTLQHRLGAGGFGVVHYGLWDGAPVAVKQLKDQELDAQAKQAFEHEAAVMDSLRGGSDYIINLRGICTGPYCMVMEYAAGGSLYSFLHNKANDIDWSKSLEMARDIGRGLKFLHSQTPQILHRDLKSENVLLTKHGDVKLTDFGLAKVKQSSSKMTAGMAGTPAWMAPEIIKRQPHSAASDVYSYAVVLSEIATRQEPFKGDEMLPIMFAVANGERPDLPDNAGTLSYRKTVINAWRQEPHERSTLGTIIDDLEAQLHESPPAQAHVKASVAPASMGFAGPASNAATASPTMGFAGAASGAPATKKPVDGALLHQLLKLVAEGEQDQAEAMLKENPDLLLHAGDVTDLSKRTFTNITAFQYALWAMDWYMYNMLLEYMPREEATKQAEQASSGDWVSRHGETAQPLIQNLIDALDAYIKKYDSGEFKKSIDNGEHWIRVVGGAQRLLPVHVINQYCHPQRSFRPTPSFTEPTLPRSRKTDEGEWFTVRYNHGTLGEFTRIKGTEDWTGWAGVRSFLSFLARTRDAGPTAGICTGDIAGDLGGITALRDVAAAQRSQLLADLKTNVRQRQHI
jgi:serine/threonine protein kinase